jgi:radical SAM superfamily enzyme YgiQ (UPF0313 family)
VRYQGTVYRPPSEAGSLIIQATIGCPHNRCAFCAMYSGVSFRKRPLPEVIEDLDLALEAYGRGVRTIFLADGNSAALPTEELVAIGDAARQRFPQLERITMYGSANFLDVHGRVPDDRQLMLEAIDEAMGFPLDHFRPPTDRLVGLSL